MEQQALNLSPVQWSFLAILEACREPISIDLIISISSFLTEKPAELIARCDEMGLISRNNDNTISLNHILPDAVQYELARINTPKNLSDLVDKIRSMGFVQRLSTSAMIRLLTKSGKIEEAAEIELELAHKNLEQCDIEQSYKFFSRAVRKLHNFIAEGGDDRNRLFVESVLELSSISFAMGRGLKVLLSYLNTAVNLAEASGNVRNHAMTSLHLGRLLASFGRVPEGLKALATGMEKVQRLGDIDILKSAAEFLGLFFSLKGKFKDALIHFERAEQQFIREEDRILIYPMILWIMGITLFATGQVPRALGFFHSYWRSARDMGMTAVASIARSHLGLLLSVAHKRTEAIFHLQASLMEARESKNAYSLYIARIGLAIQAFHDGDLPGAFILFQSAMNEGKQARSSSFINIYILDMLASFHYKGLKPTKEEWGYEAQLEMCLKDPSLHLRGIALRMRAEDKMHSGENDLLVMEDLAASKDYLHRAGTALALNDAQITLARLHLRENRLEDARLLVQSIWQETQAMGLPVAYLPEDISRLLEDINAEHPATLSAQNFAERCFDFLHELDDAEDRETLFHRSTLQFVQIFGAERGALFWNSNKKDQHTLEMIYGHNITERETHKESFKPTLALVQRSYNENTSIYMRPEFPQDAPFIPYIKRHLCMPIQVDHDVRGVLYCDNLYLDIDFDIISTQWSTLLIKVMALYIVKILKLIQLREENTRYAANKSLLLEQFGTEQILAQSPGMLNLLDMAEKVARSEATLLITGETGTGKDLLASRIHKQSLRSSGPFIVLDSTTIPENLVENELFGHEKGAFTGADSRNIGRIELAHTGTLFIDEIGELPLSVQAKLLRALETKSFYRVGGKQPVKSDFRLVAATNRQLSDEIATGRFRMDLYYRLNVIPLILPPLKERGQDIILIARRFLQHYGDTYGHKYLEITHQDEERLLSYQWPGNVRELKNVIERAVILARGNRITLDLPYAHEPLEQYAYADTPTLEEAQRLYITKILEKTGGRIGGPNGAAAILGMKRSSLYTKMYKLGIK